MRWIAPCVAYTLALSGCGDRTGLLGSTVQPDATDGSVGSSRCGDLPRSLGVLPASPLPNGLAVHEGVLYVGTLDSGPEGTVYRVQASGGPFEAYVRDAYTSGPFSFDSTHVYFMKGIGTATGPSSWGFSYPNVVAKDLGTGVELTIPNPVMGTVSGPMGNAAPGVFWSTVSVDDQQDGITRWDPATGTSMLMTGVGLRGLLVDDRRFYWASLEEDGSVLFSSDSLTGGLPTVWQTFPPNRSIPTLVAIDAASIYFELDTQFGPLQKAPKAGGAAVTVVAGAPSEAGVVVDGDFVYWADGMTQSQLLRVSVDGGTPEVLWDEPNRYVQGIATDGCDVYFTVENPSELEVLPKR